MNAKEYLEQAIVLSHDIRAHLDELENLNELSTASGAIRYDNDRVTGSAPSSAKWENVVVRLVDLENEIRKEVCELLDKHREIRDIIAQVEDADARAVLRMKYLALKSNNEIAAEMYCSKSTVLRRLDIGFQEVAKLTGYPAPPVFRMPARDRHPGSIRIIREYYDES